MDRDLALALVDVLGDIKTVLDTIATNTTPADGGDTESAAGGET